jgi:hypothetical protein
MGQTTVVCYLLYYVIAFAVSKECKVQYASEGILQGRLIIVDKTVKYSEETVFLDDIFTTLLLSEEVAYQFNCNLLSLIVVTLSPIA